MLCPSRNLPHFTETKSSLPLSQQQDTWAERESDSVHAIQKKKIFKTFELQLHLRFNKIIEFCDVVAVITTEWLQRVTVCLQSYIKYDVIEGL